MISVTSFYLLKFTAKPTSTNDTRIRESALTGCEDQKERILKSMIIYGVYDIKTDLPLCIGNTRECCAFLGIKPVSFRCIVTRQKARTGRKYKIMKLFEEDK